jgi:hypothetical protein
VAVNATAVWRVRPSGSNTNGGGYDPGISGAATDYSQQNTAQATGTLGTASGTTTFTDAGGAFTSAMIGNALWIASGAGFTTGAYFITAFGSSTSVTLDRSPGTGTAANWALGGGWADFWTNASNSAGVVASGNKVFILGSGTPNPSSYVYDYTATSAVTLAAGSTGGNGLISFENDPATPGYVAPPGMGGMPCVKVNTGAASQFLTITFVKFSGVWFVANTMSAGTAILQDNNQYATAFACVFDQFGNDIISTSFNFNNVMTATIFCEVFSSAGGSGGSNFAILSGTVGGGAWMCNIHDCVGGGIKSSINAVIRDNIIAKCSGDAIFINGGGSQVTGNTIDGNTGSGINGSQSWWTASTVLMNNIISNHTSAGKFGVNTQSSLPWTTNIFDYNVYYNNTADISNSWPYGPHDTHGGSNPYVGQSTENYTLA